MVVLQAPGNLTEEQRAKWDAAYGPKNEAFAASSISLLADLAGALGDDRCAAPASSSSPPPDPPGSDA